VSPCGTQAAPVASQTSSTQLPVQHEESPLHALPVVVQKVPGTGAQFAPLRKPEQHAESEDAGWPFWMQAVAHVPPTHALLQQSVPLSHVAEVAWQSDGGSMQSVVV